MDTNSRRGLPAPAALLPPALLCGACTCPAGIMCRVSKPAFLNVTPTIVLASACPSIWYSSRALGQIPLRRETPSSGRGCHTVA